MKTFTPILSITICLFFFASCGPSKEELEKRKQAEKARHDSVVAIYTKYKPGADEFLKKLKELRSKLVIAEDTLAVAKEMNPALSEGKSRLNSNVLLLSYAALIDSGSYSAMSDDFGMHIRSDASDALRNFKLMNKGEDIYSSSYNTMQEIERTAASLGSGSTPYILIVRRILTRPIKIEGKSSYSGGETFGAAWLADIRTMEVIGSTFFTAYPGDLRTKERESNIMLQMKAKQSSNREAAQKIKRWLKKFPGSEM